MCSANGVQLTTFGGRSLDERRPAGTLPGLYEANFLPLGGAHPFYHHQLTLVGGRNMPEDGYVDGWAVFRVPWRSLARFEPKNKQPGDTGHLQLDEGSMRTLMRYVEFTFPGFVEAESKKWKALHQVLPKLS